MRADAVSNIRVLQVIVEVMISSVNDKVSSTDVIHFTCQLHVMLKSGIVISQCCRWAQLQLVIYVFYKSLLKSWCHHSMICQYYRCHTFYMSIACNVEVRYCHQSMLWIRTDAVSNIRVLQVIVEVMSSFNDMSVMWFSRSVFIRLWWFVISVKKNQLTSANYKAKQFYLLSH